MDCRLTDLCLSLGGQDILRHVSLDITSGELVSIIGPSGAGKTTLLTLIAGLQAPDSGTISWSVPPSRKNPIILVFQDYLLFPNMTVFDNTAFGLKARRMDRKSIRSKVMDILGYFHLDQLRDQYPNQLSAGQKQRVAIARAMVVDPSMLLLDEPFANLDRNLKLETADFIRSTQQEFGITTVSVTHDLSEAFHMSDRMGIMLSGRLVQFDTPGEIYHHPANVEAARFLGPVNTLPLELCSRLGLDTCAAPGPLFARPEALRIKPDPHGPGIIESVTFAGHYICYGVRVDTHTLVAYDLDQELLPGQRVGITISRYLHSNGSP